MEYTYEFLRKCHGLRFRATLNNKLQEGIIKVTSEGVTLCYGEEDPGYLVTFGRRDTLSFSKQTLAILPGDFEIVPRDPETYKDWQVGDMVEKIADGLVANTEVIFRSGEFVVCKTDQGTASVNYLCDELFNDGYRLVLTDIEKQIINERKNAAMWEPKNGDICYAENRDGYCTPFIYRHGGSNRTAFYAALDKWGNVLMYHGCAIANGNIKMLRPATDEEKQRLFDAMAKEGKRWNAEKKVVEDIPKPYEFKEGEPVLVRDFKSSLWRIRVFLNRVDDEEYTYKVSAGNCTNEYRFCIPYNEKTMHLLGTSDNYEEEQL